MSEDRGQSDPQITQIDADLRISHRPAQTDTDIYPADPPASPERERWRAGFAGQKWSSLREKKPKEIKKYEETEQKYKKSCNRSRVQCLEIRGSEIASMAQLAREF